MKLVKAGLSVNYIAQAIDSLSFLTRENMPQVISDYKLQSVSWKETAARRFLYSWDKFLSSPYTIHDSQYDNTKNIYDIVLKKLSK